MVAQTSGKLVGEAVAALQELDKPLVCLTNLLVPACDAIAEFTAMMSSIVCVSLPPRVLQQVCLISMSIIEELNAGCASAGLPTDR